MENDIFDALLDYCAYEAAHNGMFGYSKSQAYVMAEFVANRMFLSADSRMELHMQNAAAFGAAQYKASCKD